MSGRNISLLKTAQGPAVKKLLGTALEGGKKYFTAAGKAGGGIAKGLGGGEVAQGLGTAAGVAGAAAAPLYLGRKTRVGRKAERLAGKTLGGTGRLAEKILTPGDWGMLPGETF